MITIIHGEDTAASRTFLSETRIKLHNSIVFEGSKITLTDLVQELEGGGLFEDTKSVVIENLLSQKKASPDAEEIIEYLKKHDASDVLLWEGKEVSPKNITQFKNAKAHVFSFPKSLFQFTDSLLPRNGKQMILLFHETVKTTAEELVLFMIIRQFRILLALSDSQETDQIDELKRLAPWQKSKLKKQSAAFNINNLKDLHKALYEIDLKTKTGQLSQSLRNTIDIFLLSL